MIIKFRKTSRLCHCLRKNFFSDARSKKKNRDSTRKFALLRSPAKRETVSSISRGIWVNRIQRRRRSNRIFIIFVKTELLIIISSKSREGTNLLPKFPSITKDLTVGKTKLDTFLAPSLFHAIPVPRIPFVK